ncbi:DUF397 domain-containing protein [Streptomyces luomodiensis]|uniref:DUF397 domain-containing protein n=1 Tax=Streptomyces luomodiensis TaxID=3026192 RepID=A0ABY9V4B2_9ACTN|nr:DUF397 domain-containing protein [Streptomyces sp. SCA4-21]WNE98508.1 DUF397 domain-containing protein [Streptomyces sp. SCA4-21]
MFNHDWRKSSYSGTAGNCIYVATDHDGRVKLRESDAPDVTVTFTPTTFRAFIRATKTGEFDHLSP